MQRAFGHCEGWRGTSRRCGSSKAGTGMRQGISNYLPNRLSKESREAVVNLVYEETHKAAT